jgi:hypothetical protein
VGAKIMAKDLEKLNQEAEKSFNRAKQKLFNSTSTFLENRIDKNLSAAKPVKNLNEEKFTELQTQLKEVANEAAEFGVEDFTNNLDKMLESNNLKAAICFIIAFERDKDKKHLESAIDSLNKELDND